MNAKNSNVEMEAARRLLGLPDCSTKSNIYIYCKKISPNENLRFIPAEEYQLYFLLEGSMDLYQNKDIINIPGKKLFFLTGKDNIHIKTHSECLVLMICFRELTDPVNMKYFNELSLKDSHKIVSALPLFTIPEKLNAFALKMVNDLPDEMIYPTTLELIFTFLRASFSPVQMSILFHEMISIMTRSSDKVRMDQMIHTVEVKT